MKDHVPEEEEEEEEEEELNNEDPNSQQGAGERRAEDGEPEINIDTMHGLRVALVQHYKLHKTRLREVAGDAWGWLGADTNQIIIWNFITKKTSASLTPFSTSPAPPSVLPRQDWPGFPRLPQWQHHARSRPPPS